jgi:S-disulfanyl-L-cysteine oxidoreductase SoxD
MSTSKPQHSGGPEMGCRPEAHANHTGRSNHCYGEGCVAPGFSPARILPRRLNSLATMFALLLPAALSLLSCVAQAQQGQQHPNLGHPLTPDEVQKLDITVFPDGRGLPAGSGSVATGATVYAQKCQACHGQQGQGGPMERLTGGVGTLATDKAVKTPVSYWPNSTTIFDYIRRAMPINTPQSLTNDEAYAVTAYLLSIDGVVPKDATLDAKSLPQVKMPNRDGFIRYWPEPKK